MKIAIDPGSRATGVVIFLPGGKLISETFYPKKNNILVRESRRELVDRILGWMSQKEREHKDPIKQVVIEGFVKYVNPKLASRLKILFEFTGYLHGRMEAFCDVRGAELLEVSKGKSPKDEGKFLARAYNFVGDTPHEYDAFHLGILAGFYARLA